MSNHKHPKDTNRHQGPSWLAKSTGASRTIRSAVSFSFFCTYFFFVSVSVALHAAARGSNPSVRQQTLPTR